MYKSPVLCWFAICRRCVIIMGLMIMMLLGLYEAHHAFQTEDNSQEGLRRLAIYGIVMRTQR